VRRAGDWATAEVLANPCSYQLVYVTISCRCLERWNIVMPVTSAKVLTGSIHRGARAVGIIPCCVSSSICAMLRVARRGSLMPRHLHPCSARCFPSHQLRR